MMDDRAWLAALQLADSQFPSGAFTQSHGLEGLAADGLLENRDALVAVLEMSLRERLATSDLPALLAAHTAAAASSHMEVRDIDVLLSATKLPREEREASRRVGKRIAAEAARLVATNLALNLYIEAIERRETPGNAGVAQGVAAAALGIPARVAALGACHSLCASLVSAAMRLTRLGHGEAQAALRAVQPTMAEAVALAERLDWREMRSRGFRLDIAMARHEGSQARMFAS
jgi:urease accessory protein